MDAEIKEKWIDALRGGEYAQTKKCLRDKSGYCCLGVLCDVINPAGWIGDAFAYRHSINIGSLPDNLREELGIPADEEHDVICMNDNGKTFEQIADYIEELL